jgi:hypothetical protein
MYTPRRVQNQIEIPSGSPGPGELPSRSAHGPPYAAGAFALAVGATLREDTPILSPDARPHRPRLHLNLLTFERGRAAPFVFADVFVCVFVGVFAGVFVSVFVDLDLSCCFDLIKHNVHPTSEAYSKLYTIPNLCGQE